MTDTAILRAGARVGTMIGDADDLPLTERDVSTMMEALFDIRGDTHEILTLLEDDDEEEEEDT
jgi:hypothetical protein